MTQDAWKATQAAPEGLSPSRDPARQGADTDTDTVRVRRACETVPATIKDSRKIVPSIESATGADKVK